MFELVYGKPPYIAENHIQLQKLIDTSPPPPMNRIAEAMLPSGRKIRYTISTGCLALIKGLLQKNALERMSHEEFFSHPLLRDDANIGAQKTYFIPIRRTVSHELSWPSHSDTASPTKCQSYFSQAAQAAKSLSLSASYLPPFARIKGGSLSNRLSSNKKFEKTAGISIQSSCCEGSNNQAVGVHLKFLYKLPKGQLRDKLVFSTLILDLAAQNESSEIGHNHSYHTSRCSSENLAPVALSILIDVLDFVRSSNNNLFNMVWHPYDHLP